jgi:hypothetical protein
MGGSLVGERPLNGCGEKTIDTPGAITRATREMGLIFWKRPKPEPRHVEQSTSKRWVCWSVLPITWARLLQKKETPGRCGDHCHWYKVNYSRSKKSPKSDSFVNAAPLTSLLVLNQQIQVNRQKKNFSWIPHQAVSLFQHLLSFSLQSLPSR